MLRKGLFRKPENKLEILSEAPGTAKAAGEEGSFSVCRACGAATPDGELASALGVCPKCGRYAPLGARARISMTVDPGSFEEADADLVSRDLIGFPGYTQKLDDARVASGEKEAVVSGTARISDHPCELFAMEPRFMMGSMGVVVGEKVARTFERATERSLPVVTFTASGGARMQEGTLSLMQMARTSAAVRRHSEGGNLYIVVLCDPTAGGVMASFAMQSDIALAEPGALVCFAGPRVIEQTTRQKLPPGFQMAEFLLEKGFVDAIVPREKQRETLALLLSLHVGEARNGSF